MAGLRAKSPAKIGGEIWGVAESATRDVLFKIWPTLIADKKRHDIIDYLQSLVKYFTGCEIFSYGSVPLKTYLPDGDIDLSCINPNIPDAALASDVYDLLRREEHNDAARFKVKDVHRIDAEVKLVKCIVDDIIVDISFNQLGGLSALCFLEQIDRHTSNDHLFKRSIMLIKAWCYYESRILGAHHGLISTYALEILVLHIFDVFHKSLQGPLSVLYTFLDYFSSFDWENYCISLRGPIGKSFRHDVDDELPKIETFDRLLSEEFLNSCREEFFVSSYGLETKLQPFPLKHFNIIDPLKENNNLGRSVNRGSFFRIRSAFKYGANKLGWVLSLPAERISDEINAFFSNSVGINISNYGNIVPGIIMEKGAGISTKIKKLNVTLTLNQEDKQKRTAPKEVVVSFSFPTEAAFIDSMALIGNSKLDKKISSAYINPVDSSHLLDLGGDYEGHFRNLRYGQLCLVHTKTPTWCPVYLPPQHCNSSWKPQTYCQNGYGHDLRPQCSRARNPELPCSSGFTEENWKSRGTGTYLPNMNYGPYNGRTCGQYPMRHDHRSGDNWLPVPDELSAYSEWEPGQSQTEYLNVGNESNNCTLYYYEPESWESSLSASQDSNNDNSPATPSPETDSDASLSAASSEEWVEERAYRLKDEGDFPPLTA